MNKFCIGDVLYFPEGEYHGCSIFIITNITDKLNDIVPRHPEECHDVFYHVETFYGYDHGWFTGNSPIYRSCILMVSNLNDAEKLAMML